MSFPHLLTSLALLALLGIGLFTGFIGRQAWREANEALSIGARGTAVFMFVLTALFFSAAAGFGVMALFH